MKSIIDKETILKFIEKKVNDINGLDVKFSMGSEFTPLFRIINQESSSEDYPITEEEINNATYQVETKNYIPMALSNEGFDNGSIGDIEGNNRITLLSYDFQFQFLLYLESPAIFQIQNVALQQIKDYFMQKVEFITYLERDSKDIDYLGDDVLYTAVFNSNDIQYLESISINGINYFVASLDLSVNLSKDVSFADEDEFYIGKKNDYYFDIKVGEEYLRFNESLSLVRNGNYIRVQAKNKGGEFENVVNPDNENGFEFLEIELYKSYLNDFLTNEIKAYKKMTVRISDSITNEFTFNYFNEDENLETKKINSFFPLIFENIQVLERVYPMLFSWGKTNNLEGTQLLKNKNLIQEHKLKAQYIHNSIATSGYSIVFSFLVPKSEEGILSDLYEETDAVFKEIENVYIINKKRARYTLDDTFLEKKVIKTYSERFERTYEMIIGESILDQTSYGEMKTFSVGFSLAYNLEE